MNGPGDVLAVLLLWAVLLVVVHSLYGPRK